MFREPAPILLIAMFFWAIMLVEMGKSGWIPTWAVYCGGIILIVAIAAGNYFLERAGRQDP